MSDLSNEKTACQSEQYWCFTRNHAHIFVRLHNFLDARQWQLLVFEVVQVPRCSIDLFANLLELLHQLLLVLLDFLELLVVHVSVLIKVLLVHLAELGVHLTVLAGPVRRSLVLLLVKHGQMVVTAWRSTTTLIVIHLVSPAAWMTSPVCILLPKLCMSASCAVGRHLRVDVELSSALQSVLNGFIVAMMAANLVTLIGLACCHIHRMSTFL